MITNLLATVTFALITNVTEVPTDYASQRTVPCPDGRLGCLVLHYEGVDPRGKLITTQVIMRSTATFGWLGKQHRVVNDETLSSETKHLKLEWVEQKPEPPHPNSGFTTNLMDPGAYSIPYSVIEAGPGMVWTNTGIYTIEAGPGIQMYTNGGTITLTATNRLPNVVVTNYFDGAFTNTTDSVILFTPEAVRRWIEENKQ